MGQNDNPRVWAKNLAQAAKDQVPRTLILGAGASRSSGVPGWQDLAQRIADHFEIETGTGDPLPSVVEFLRNNPQNRSAIPSLLGDSKPSSGYLHLAQLLADRVFDLIITTNWDSLLDAALVTTVPGHPFKTLIRGEVPDEIISDYLDHPPAATLIVKLHGDVTARLFRLTPDELQGKDGPLEDALKRRLSGHVVIVGHSLEDDDVVDLFRRQDDRHRAVTYVNPGKPSSDALKVPCLRDSAKIEMTFDEYFTKLNLGHREERSQRGKADLRHFLDVIGPTSERGITYFNTEAVRTMAEQLAREVIRADPDLVVVIDDPTAPGGSEVLHWLRKDRSWQRAQDAGNIRTATAKVKRSSVSSSSRKGPIDIVLEPAGVVDDVLSEARTIVVIDSSAFSGTTMIRVAEHLRSAARTRGGNPSPIKVAGALLVVHHSLLEARHWHEAFDVTIKVVVTESREITFPWGGTEATNDLLLRIPDLPSNRSVITSRAPWGWQEILGGQDTQSVRLHTLDPDEEFSFHRHLCRSELFMAIDDGVRVVLSSDRPSPREGQEDWDFTSIILEPGHPLIVPQGLWHQVKAPRRRNARLLEIAFGLYDSGRDKEYARDKYNRRSGPAR